ncbi:MAG: hypothetical protein JNL28_01450 [Planctomycetes bacterium]|nr:hypothetical protein [Planctomycetota bacterium]
MSLFDSTPPSTPRSRVIAFDIEIANQFELAPGEDLEDHGPFDISVAASTTGDGSVRHWYARGADGRPARHIDATIARDMLTFLRREQSAGALVCAWNGMAFDLRWLGHAAGDDRLAAEVALDLYDPMFQFVSKRGFPVSLAAVADGLGVKETKLMSGADAPKEWAAGNHQKVIDYVAGDCRLTREVVERILARREVRWRTKKGTLSSESFAKLERVRDVMRAPPPDQSWMSDPKPWTSWFSWLTPFATRT